MSVTQDEKLLSIESTQDFEKGNFKQCINVLDRIIQSRSNDPKVLHNRAIAEFYRSGFRKTDEFKQDLNLVCKKAQVSLLDEESLEDADHCVIFFNHAIILYHLKQWRTAIRLLERVYQYLEPLNERLKRRVCFLLTELYLCTNQPVKALSMIENTEQLLFEARSDREGETDKTSQEQSSSNDIYIPRIQHYKVRCYLQQKSIKACKKDLKALSNVVQSASSSQETYMFNSGLSDTVIYLKANFEYMKGNYRKAMKILAVAPGTFPPFVESGQCVPAMYFNNLGCIHFHLRKHNLGLFYCQKSLEEMDRALSMLPAKEAVTSQLGQSLSGRPIHTITSSRRYELLHNIGLQLLFCGKPLQAFDCLLEVVQVYHNNPRLWLRLAECCISAQKLDNEQLLTTKLKAQDLVRCIAGQGPHKKIILKPLDANKPSTRLDGPSAAIPNATMEFAILCLKNALQLLPEKPSPEKADSDAKGESEEAEKPAVEVRVPAPPGSPLNAEQVSGLRCSVLASCAYVSLHVGDSLMALRYAERLLTHPDLPGVYKYLGHLYAAEALILLDRISEAVDNLTPEISNLSMRLPTDSAKADDNDDTGKSDTFVQAHWFPDKSPVAMLVMQYNLCVAYTIRGEFEKAQQMLWKLAALFKSTTGLPEIPAHLLVLALYVSLQLGHTDMARVIIKQNFPSLRT